MDCKINYHAYILVLFSLWIFVGCNSDLEQKSLLINAHQFSLEQSLNSDTVNLDINRFFNLKSAIILEFPENRPIQNIHKIIVSKLSLFILDNVQNYIYVYDLQGNFLNRIGGIGDGPGEYLDITDFTIAMNELIVFSNSSRKIIHYDIAGNLIKEVPILFFGESLVKYNGGYILQTKNNVYPQMPYDLILLNASGEKIDLKQKIDPEFPVFESTGFLTKTDENFRYMKIFGDMVYEIGREFNLTPLYQVDLGPTALDISQFNNPEELTMHYHEYTHMTNFYWENDSLVLFYYFHNLKMRFGFITKSDWRFFTHNQFRNNEVIDIFRSIQAGGMAGNRLFISTNPGFNQSEYNFDMIDSLVNWVPNNVTSKSDKIKLIENSNGLIFEMDVLN